MPTRPDAVPSSPSLPPAPRQGTRPQRRITEQAHRVPRPAAAGRGRRRTATTPQLGWRAAQLRRQSAARPALPAAPPLPLRAAPGGGPRPAGLRAGARCPPPLFAAPKALHPRFCGTGAPPPQLRQPPALPAAERGEAAAPPQGAPRAGKAAPGPGPRLPPPPPPKHAPPQHKGAARPGPACPRRPPATAGGGRGRPAAASHLPAPPWRTPTTGCSPSPAAAVATPPPPGPLTTAAPIGRAARAGGPGRPLTAAAPGRADLPLPPPPPPPRFCGSFPPCPPPASALRPPARPAPQTRCPPAAAQPGLGESQAPLPPPRPGQGVPPALRLRPGGSVTPRERGSRSEHLPASPGVSPRLAQSDEWYSPYAEVLLRSGSVSSKSRACTPRPK